jgi:hypothetical protein
MPDKQRESGKQNSKGGFKDIVSFTQGVIPLVVAIIVLYIFWSLVKMMMGQTKAPELEWSRSAYIFGGVEAVAYAAAGFLFGREVHRQRAEKAERRAEDEQQRATEANQKATEETVKGQTLKKVINAKRASRSVVVEMEGLEGREIFETTKGLHPSVTSRSSELDELSKIADELFP